MRDDRDLWSAPRGLQAPLALPGADLSAVTLTRQTMISGASLSTSKAPRIGWPEIVQTDNYRLSLRRDRIVDVNGVEKPDGWDDASGQATSDVTHGCSVFQLTGPDAFGILKRGTEISLSQPSASVARKLFGLDVWLYRFGSKDGFRLHVAHAFGETLIAHLNTAAHLAQNDG